MGKKKRNRADRLTAALGRGLVAGVLGTAAMTVSSTTEAKVTGRDASTLPAQAVGKVVGVTPRGEAGRQRLNTVAHWGYGISWGAFRGALDAVGLRGPLASLVHFAAVLGAEQVMLPALGIGSPTPAYGAKAFGIDSLHHAVYAGAAGVAYDLLQRR